MMIKVIIMESKKSLGEKREVAKTYLPAKQEDDTHGEEEEDKELHH